MVPQIFGPLRPAGVEALRQRRRGLHARRRELLRRRHAARCSRSCSGLSFLLLLVAFRSVVIPIKAILLNLLSTGAAYGVLVLVFQEGWFARRAGGEARASSRRSCR